MKAPKKRNMRWWYWIGKIGKIFAQTALDQTTDKLNIQVN